MNGDDTRFSIGDLARMTGLSVKTIRFYSDAGVVPPVERSPAGYRLYDLTALARLRLVRTLRDLDISIPTIQRVLAREVELAEIANVHAEAIDAQIRTLRLRRAVLRALAKRGATPEEVELLHKLAQLSEAERQRIIDDFLDEVFGGLDVDPKFVERMRSARPDLPDDPTPEQVNAWVELAELVQDPSYRKRVRQMAVQSAAIRAENAAQFDGTNWQKAAAVVADKGGAALTEGVDPASAQARSILEGMLAELRANAPVAAEAARARLRTSLVERIETGLDPRAERYWQLLAIINGWPPTPSTTPAWSWFLAALKAHPEALAE